MIKYCMFVHVLPTVVYNSMKVYHPRSSFYLVCMKPHILKSPSLSSSYMFTSSFKSTYEYTPAHTHTQAPAKLPSYTSSLLHTAYILHSHEKHFVTTLIKTSYGFITLSKIMAMKKNSTMSVPLRRAINYFFLIVTLLWSWKIFLWKDLISKKEHFWSTPYGCSWCYW